VQFVCILILSLIGWASQPSYSVPSTGAFDEAYRLPDGTFSDICAESGQHQKQTPAGHCDQCIAAGLVVLPSPHNDTWMPDRVWHVAILPLVRSRLVEMLSIDRATSRGPPVAV
jgi:hypothetical protein